MSIQDKLERILRELHIQLSKGKGTEMDPEEVIVNKANMLNQLTLLSETVAEMMEQYEVTQSSKDRADRESARKKESILKEAAGQAEDIYAASMIYTDDTLSRIQSMIDTANRSVWDIVKNFEADLIQEKQKIKSNQRELKNQLETLKDTEKYLRIIEEKNKEQKKQDDMTEQDQAEQRKSAEWSRRHAYESSAFTAVKAEIKIDKAYFEEAGIDPETMEPVKNYSEIRYEKPEIKVNPEYFRKAGIRTDEGFGPTNKEKKNK
ncbi:MAG: hypothetical protein ACK5ML_07310 [Lachnospiraceae bacterium]